MKYTQYVYAYKTQKKIDFSSEYKSYRLVSLNALTKGPFFNFDGKIAGLAQLSKLSIHDSKVNLVVEEGGQIKNGFYIS